MIRRYLRGVDRRMHDFRGHHIRAWQIPITHRWLWVCSCGECWPL